MYYASVDMYNMHVLDMYMYMCSKSLCWGNPQPYLHVIGVKFVYFRSKWMSNEHV